MLNQLEFTTAEMYLMQDLFKNLLDECEGELNQLNRDLVMGEDVPGGAKRIESLKSHIALLNGIVNKGDAILDTLDT